MKGQKREQQKKRVLTQNGVTDAIHIILGSLIILIVSLYLISKVCSIIVIFVVSKFLESGEPVELPVGYPQDKNVVLEQLQIMKSLTGSTRNLSVNIDTASESSASSSSYKKVEKTTCFVANSGTKYTKTTGLSTLEKLKLAAPYNLLFTAIPESSETLKQHDSITITGSLFCLIKARSLHSTFAYILDLLCPSLGEIKCSLQINFMIDIMWLMEQYDAQGVG